MPLAALCLLLAPPASPPIDLGHRFSAHEKLAYNITSHMTAEVRMGDLQTFIPEDLDINYGYDYTVQSLLPDGVAVVKFIQPSVTEIEGETATSPPKSKTEKSDKVYQLTLSPANEILDRKDITPPKPKKPVKKGRSSAMAMLRTAGAAAQAPIFGEYVSEMHRLALFFGTMDFSPKLPLEPVKVGDSWKRTVGYQPQKLKGKDGKSAVQRLDYTYTYMGPVTVDGQQRLRIQATLDLKTDLGEYLKTLLEGSQLETNLKSMPLHMKATIDFFLDPKTRDTLSASAQSEGGFEINVKEQDTAVYEERFKGRTDLTLAGRKVLPTGR